MIAVEFGVVVRLELDGSIVFSPPERPTEPADDYEDERIVTYNYFMLRESDGAIKIGYSFQPEHRALQLRRDHGNMKIIATMEGDLDAERLLHLRFEEYRMDGEFFRYEGALAEYLRNEHGYER